jgi:hypothetical protein
MMVFLMCLKVLSQLRNALTQKGYLNLWRSRIRFMNPVLSDYFRFLFYRQGHARNDTPRLYLNLEFIPLDGNTIEANGERRPSARIAKLHLQKRKRLAHHVPRLTLGASFVNLDELGESPHGYRRWLAIFLVFSSTQD